MKNIWKALLTLLLLPAIVFAETPEQVGFLIGGLTDSSGNPLASGKVYTYACGTTTNKTTWQDGSKAVSHANPIVLDSEGKKLAFADGCYKFRIDSSADATLYTLDNLRFGLYNGGASYAGATTGSVSAYVATLSPTLLTLTNGVTISFKANHTNTTAATLNVSGLGATTLNKANDTAFAAGEIVSGSIYTAIYDSTLGHWLVQSPTWNSGTYTPTLTGVTNVAASTAFPAFYTRMGNLVDVSGWFDVDPTAGAPTATELGISLPIASNLTGVDCFGVCAASASTTERAAAINADSTNDRCRAVWATADTANHTMYCKFTYVVK